MRVSCTCFQVKARDTSLEPTVPVLLKTLSILWSQKGDRMILRAVNCLCFYIRGVSRSILLHLMIESRLSGFMAEYILNQLCFFVPCNELTFSSSGVHEALYASLICSGFERNFFIFNHSQAWTLFSAILSLDSSLTSKPHSW